MKNVLKIDEKPPKTYPGSSMTCAKNVKKETPKMFWFFTKFKKCAKNRRKISLNILGLISRIETELRRPSSFKEYQMNSFEENGQVQTQVLSSFSGL